MHLVEISEEANAVRVRSRERRHTWVSISREFEELGDPERFNEENRAKVKISGYKLSFLGVDPSRVYVDLRTGEWFGSDKEILEVVFRFNDESDPDYILETVRIQKSLEGSRLESWIKKGAD